MVAIPSMANAHALFMVLLLSLMVAISYASPKKLFFLVPLLPRYVAPSIMTTVCAAVLASPIRLILAVLLASLKVALSYATNVFTTAP